MNCVIQVDIYEHVAVNLLIELLHKCFRCCHLPTMHICFQMAYLNDFQRKINVFHIREGVVVIAFVFMVSNSSKSNDLGFGS